MSIRLEIIHGDALEFRTEVLALKFAQHLFGLDRKVVDLLEKNGVRIKSRLPPVGSPLLVNSGHSIAATEVLFVGVAPLGAFNYETVREFARSVLTTLGETRPSLQHLAMTLHGVGFGLDEAEAFRAEIAGLLDAVAMRRQPRGLTRISIIERDAQAVRRLSVLLSAILPTGVVDVGQSARNSGLPALSTARANLGEVGHDSNDKPHVFVAMPFAEQYKDRYHYGIEPPVRKAGYLCERLDHEYFTGDVLARVKDRINTAALLVVDLTEGNPNVYLEAGYAWGRGVDTILIVAEGEKVWFDIQGQRRIEFSSIRQLEQLLTTALEALRTEANTTFHKAP